ncbi:hypothetical protein, partial [Tritonibacter sp. SIMBA_163]|uniref:hypothetical protein n=1 Tax=Tritonibacter sp. SIMBA_163 TaxID=3080868 RepID=UPI00398028F5
GLALELAKHDAVDALWWFGDQATAEALERASTGNLKRMWTDWHERDWFDAKQAEGAEVLRHACQVKNIWIPYGE